jgi:hypothetical protein
VPQFEIDLDHFFIVRQCDADGAASEMQLILKCNCDSGCCGMQGIAEELQREKFVSGLPQFEIDLCQYIPCTAV